MHSSSYALVISLMSFVLFWTVVAYDQDHKDLHIERPPFVYVDGPTQILLYAGDRFLAANIEAIRAVASATSKGADQFIIRAHKGVSRLNPCHEDNYWVGNASLSWGGSVKQGFEVLNNAMHCRYWDEFPAFFYGFNKHFFNKDTPAARNAIELAAQRSTHNASEYRNFSIMLAVEEIDDTSMAIKMLEHERDLPTTEADLKEMLDLRVTRLQGLLLLRNAQKEFEAKYDKPLTDPQKLLSSGIISSFPKDPLGKGYVFREHEFHLQEVQITY